MTDASLNPLAGLGPERVSTASSMLARTAAWWLSRRVGGIVLMLCVAVFLLLVTMAVSSTAKRSAQVSAPTVGSFMPWSPGGSSIGIDPHVSWLRSAHSGIQATESELPDQF